MDAAAVASTGYAVLSTPYTALVRRRPSESDVQTDINRALPTAFYAARASSSITSRAVSDFPGSRVTSAA
jgi:hypothetical protein